MFLGEQSDKTEHYGMCLSAPASSSVSEHLVWSVADLPTDGQTVALLTSVVENPGRFYCRLSSPTGFVIVVVFIFFIFLLNVVLTFD